MHLEYDGGLSQEAGVIFTSTALATIIRTTAMDSLGKFSFGLAPDMGLNAFFVYTVCSGCVWEVEKSVDL